MTTSMEVLAAQRREITEIASTLRAMLSPVPLQNRPVAQAARRLLCDLCRKTGAHLEEEGEDLYPSLLAFGDIRIQHLAWGFQASDRPLQQLFEDYERRWLRDCDFEFTQRFLTDTVELLDAIEKRVRREQQVMIPQIEEAGIFPRATA